MGMVNRIIRYFDLFNRYRSATPVGRTGGGQEAPSNWWIFAQYAALYLGIIAKVFLDSLEKTHEEFSFSWIRFVVAAITATAIFPAVYEKALVASGPSFVQCCVTFAAGLGYKTLIDIKV